MQIGICLIPSVALSLLQQLHGPMPGLHISPFGKLKVGESQLTITRGSATHHREVTRMCNALVQRQQWTPLNAMVRHLFVGHVSCLLTRHVALATVRLIGVVLADE
jgi:hypothetical protein